MKVLSKKYQIPNKIQLSIPNVRTITIGSNEVLTKGYQGPKVYSENECVTLTPGPSLCIKGSNDFSQVKANISGIYEKQSVNFSNFWQLEAMM